MPLSRLTITPADFERWLAGNLTDSRDVAETEPRGPRLTAPPPPPVLLTPPPPPPNLGPVRIATPAPKPAALSATAATTPEAPAPGRTPPAEMPAIIQTPAAPSAPPAPPAIVAAAPMPGPMPPAATATPAAPPPAPPPPAPITETPEQQIATLPPDSRDTPALPEPEKPPLQPGTIRISFAAEATDLSQGARARLDEIAARLKAWPDVRVQIVGYASEPEEASGLARRRALFRVISVRKYLVGQGVLSTRMDVRALGDNTEILPQDRVDVILPPS